jgi:hypothetical protein
MNLSDYQVNSIITQKRIISRDLKMEFLLYMWRTKTHNFIFFKNLFYFYYHIIVVLGVQCDIYKSAYNVS